MDEFRAAIDPLASAGKLGALLAQFPASFKNEPTRAATWSGCSRPSQDYPLAVELRHRSFSDDPAETLRLLERARRGARPDRRAEVPVLDPPDPAGQREDVLLHAAARPERRAVVEARKSEDRYNYLYSASELDPFVDAAEEASRDVKKTYLYANNHFSAKSVANAATIKNKLGQQLDGEYPEAFVERYPDLKGLVRILPPRPSDKLV